MTSPLPSPIEVSPRASDVVHAFRSFWVYPTTVGFPVVPLETWYRTSSSCGSGKYPVGIIVPQVSLEHEREFPDIRKFTDIIRVHLLFFHPVMIKR